MAVVATAGRAAACARRNRGRGRLKPGDRAMLFVRPEALRAGRDRQQRRRPDHRPGRPPRSSRVRATTSSWPAPSGIPIRTSLVNQGAEPRRAGVGADADRELRSAQGGGAAAPGELADGRSRRAWARAAGPRRFVDRNGWLLATYILVAVSFWILVLIVLPQLVMLDFSLRHDLPPAKQGGPEDVCTLANYRYFLFGFPGNPDGWNYVDLARLRAHPRRLGSASPCSTSCICYPIAYYLAQVGERRRPRASWPWR